MKSNLKRIKKSKKRKKILRKFDFLDDAIWIKEKKDLAQVISSPLGGEIFFVHLTSKRDAIDEMVLIVRDALHSAKIIYVMDDPKTVDLKSHQMSPVGGDLYVSMQIDASSN